MKDKTIKTWIYVIFGIIVFSLIIYVLIIYLMYTNSSYIFLPYEQPEPPEESFFPLGEIRPLSQEEIDARNEIINANVDVSSNN